uniref:Reverse transcriptase domain-containing protein n=1 Tax=Hordeum vulgare subsp. vulgare TaxID=112509 RepID=A0A8I7B9N1_HORVV
MLLFDWFHENNLDVERLNYGIITMLPKVAGADKMQQFKPICLLRCIYKLITKVLTIRLEPHVDVLFSRHQNAFIKNRDIMDGIMSLHEILHHTYAQKKKGIVLKLDFEKAYDKVNWEFLLECHSKRNFDPRWIDWIRRILVGGTISVKLNDEVGEYFQSAKGVRQGDPLSPFLFNLAADCLTKMVLKAQENGMFTGLATDLVENGVAILQYADDTILCFEDNVSNALNIKLLLYIFEIMSGLKINFLKSEIFLVGADDDTMRNYADMLNCEIGAFPIKYLGMPVSYPGLKWSDWIFVDDKFISHGESWISESLSSGGRLIKVNAVLSHIPSYYMSMALIKKSTLEKWDKPRRKFFWHRKGRKGYHMVKWTRVCRSKAKGGLGVKDLRKQNISLLAKWWWKLEKKKGLWQDIVKAKYLRRTSVAKVKQKAIDSPYWKNILKVKEHYMAGRGVVLKKGNIASLWLDDLGENILLKDRYPDLFEICLDKECTVDKVESMNHLTSFRRRLSPAMLQKWDEMKKYVLDKICGDKNDEVYSKLDNSREYSTKSMYRWLERILAGAHYNWIWGTKIPLKIQIFLWQLFQNSILTRDNTRKRQWHGDPKCSFCDELESAQHLFFGCSVAKIVWRMVGAVFCTSYIPKTI